MQQNKIVRELVRNVGDFLLNYKNDNHVRDGIATVLGGHLAMHGLANMNQLGRFNNFLFSSRKVIFIDPGTIGTRNLQTDVILNLNPKFELLKVIPIEVRSKILIKYIGKHAFFYSQYSQLQHGCGVTLIGSDFEATTIPFDGKVRGISGCIGNLFVRGCVDAGYRRET